MSTKQESRNEAKRERNDLIDSAGYRCEVCGYYCPFTAVVHHIEAVKRGGSGSVNNLIVLCPDCHAVVHLIMSVRLRNRNKASKVNDWLKVTYSKEQMALLKGLGHGRVERVGGVWKPIYIEDVQWPEPITPQHI